MPLLARMRESIWSMVSPSSSAHKKQSRDAVQKRKTPHKKTQRTSLLSTPWTGDDDSTLVATSPVTPSKIMDKSYAYAGSDVSSDDSQEGGAVNGFEIRDDTAEVIGEYDDLEGTNTINAVDESRSILKREREMVECGWTVDEVQLYFELDARGSKPIFPDNWADRDLPTLPLQLFAYESQEKDCFMIRNHRGKEFRAIRAVSDLIDLGPMVRDSRDCHCRPERTLHRGVRSFWKWAVNDAEMDEASPIPNLVVLSGSTKVSMSKLKAGMKVSFRKLERRFEDYLAAQPQSDTREIPTLFGLIASSTVFAIVAYSSAREDRSLRTIGIFDYKEMPMDVWNSIAIMVLVAHCRQKLELFYNA